jgi:hypothetical protein
LIKGDKCDKEIEIFAEHPRLGQISRHNTKLTPGVSHRGDDKKGKRREKKRYYKKKGGDAHVCREWDSDESSTDSSSDEDAANIAVTKGLLFPNVGHKCLMAKDGKKKVKSRSSTKYATSSDETNSSDDEDNLLTLFCQPKHATKGEIK